MAISFSMLLSLISCSKKDDNNKPEFNLNVCISNEPGSIDPTIVPTIAGLTYDLHIFEGLVKYVNADNHTNNCPNMFNTQIVEGQAERYSVSDDQCVYTFYLRDDILWSDGVEVTAKDFVYSWQRLVDPATAAAYGYLLNDIVLNASEIQSGSKNKNELGIKAVDDRTLEVTLVNPCPYFLEICAYSCLCPLREDVVNKGENWTDPGKIVVNGAYTISEWVHDSYIKMTQNENYYDKNKVGPDSITWWLSDNETSVANAYMTDEYQFISTLPVDMIQYFKESGDFYSAPNLSTRFLIFNCEKIKDWRVRAAFTLAIDRNNITDNVTRGGEVPANSWISAGITNSEGKFYSEGKSGMGVMFEFLNESYSQYDLSTYKGRCDLAKELYNNAVEDKSWEPSTIISYSYGTSDINKAIAEACCSDWSSVLGIKVQLDNQESSTYVSFLGERNFDIARLKWNAAYNDPMSHLEMLLSDGPFNFGNFMNADYDKFVREAKKSPIGSNRDESIYSAEKILFSEEGFPISPILFPADVFCVKSDLSDIGFITMGTYCFIYTNNA